MEAAEYFRPHLVPVCKLSGNVWRCMTIYGNAWQCVIIFGKQMTMLIGQCMTMPSNAVLATLQNTAQMYFEFSVKLYPWFLLPQFYQWPVLPCFDKFFKYHTAVEEISYPVKSANFDEDCYTDYKYALQPRVKQLQCDVKQLHILYNLPAFLSDVPWCPRGGIQHNQATMLTRENCKGSDMAGFEYFLVGRCILQETYSTSMQLLSWGWGEVINV